MKLPAILMLFMLLSGCSGEYTWGWYAISPFNNIGSSNVNFLLSGLGYTISVSLISIFFATLLGLNISAINGLSHIDNAIMPATNAEKLIPTKTGSP